MTRRNVLLATAAAGVAGLAGNVLAQTAKVEDLKLPAEPQSDWPRVSVAFTRPRGKYWLGWPGTAWPLDDYVNKSRRLVEQFAQELKIRVNFEPEPIYEPADTEKFINQVKASQPQGLLLFPLHFQEFNREHGPLWKIAACSLPTVIFCPLGTCFTNHIQELSRQPGVYLSSSPDFELKPVRFGLKMIRTAHNIRRSKIAVLRKDATSEEKLDPFGLTIRNLPRNRFVEALKTIPECPEVLAVAEEYKKAAQKIVEPTQADLVNAAKNYFAAVKIMNEEGCNGISMDCLGAVYDKHIPCPPCLAWSKLLDRGVIGVCEADLHAVMSHLLCCELLDKPGFMQDPVPNTVDNTFIGAHCVCGTRLNGYAQPREKFILRSHSESDIGVAVQVLWKPGQEVTIMQMTSPGTMIVGQGKVLRNFDTPPAGGCRTSVELEIDAPPETRDTKGFHQLFIYGKHMRDFQAYGQMYGLKVEHV